MNLIEALAIPNSALVDQRIAKKLYYDNVSMNIAQKKLFKEELESLRFVYNIAPSTMNIPHFINEEYHYDNIAVIEASLKSRKYASALAEIIHKVPYPIILILNAENQTQLSLTPKRINRADNTKRTLEASIATDWIDPQNPSEHEQLFLDSLSLSSMSYENLYKLYEAIIERITALLCSKHVATFTIPTDGTTQRLGLEQIASLQSRMSELRNRLKKADQFNEKIQINIDIKEIEKQIDLVKQGLLWKN